MRTVNAYDYEADVIEQLAEQHDVTEPEIVQAMIDALRANEIDLADYL